MGDSSSLEATEPRQDVVLGRPLESKPQVIGLSARGVGGRFSGLQTQEVKHDDLMGFPGLETHRNVLGHHRSCAAEAPLPPCSK